MTNTGKPHSPKNVFPEQTNAQKNQQPHGDVRQDKARISRARIASAQSASVTKMPRARQLEKIRIRSQKHPMSKEKAVQVTAWVNPLVKAELEKLAKREGMSVSRVAAALLEKALQTRIDLEYSALLKPIIEQAITREMRGISTRLAWLSVRVAFDAGQTRSLVTNILGRQPGVTPDVLKTILEGSGKTARSNIMRRTPQLTEFIEAVEQWLVTEDKEGTIHSAG